MAKPGLRKDLGPDLDPQWGKPMDPDSHWKPMKIWNNTGVLVFIN